MTEQHEYTPARIGSSCRAILRASLRIVAVVAVVPLAACGAKPDAVCDKAAELAQGADASVDANQCAFVWEMRYETLSVFEYKSKADCAMEATSLDALNAC